MALPHITNSEAGRNLYDPVFKNIFEVYFTLPEPIASKFEKDTALITEHVTKVGGLNALNRAPGVGTQKFMGTERSFINPRLDNTSADIEVTLNLNLRNSTDNYIYKLFKAWKNLNYDLETGTIVTKPNYTADWLRICIANRAGDVIREIVFKDVMLKGNIEGMSDLDYSNNEPVNITVHFASDWWKETIA